VKAGLLRRAEAAQRLAVSDRTLARLIARGELAVHRIGNQVRLEPDELERFIRNARELAPEPRARRLQRQRASMPEGVPDFEKIRA
jgi:excisionase family DNA binding protein